MPLFVSVILEVRRIYNYWLLNHLHWVAGTPLAILKSWTDKNMGFATLYCNFFIDNDREAISQGIEHVLKFLGLNPIVSHTPGAV